MSTGKLRDQLKKAHRDLETVLINRYGGKLFGVKEGMDLEHLELVKLYWRCRELKKNVFELSGEDLEEVAELVALAAISAATSR
jgi:hypothetical protein